MSERASGQSESVENFLKAVYTLQQAARAGERISTNALAELLGVKAPSVTDMARRMEESGLIHYRRYQGVTLTEAGRHIALQVIRRHRLIELYLVEQLNYALHEVHDEAERLEHAVSDRFIAAISEKLGHPAFDPHGDPIPQADGSIRRRNLVRLSELGVNVEATIARFTAESNDMLLHILERGFILNRRVVVLAQDPFNGPLTVHIDGQDHVIGHNVATCVLVERRSTQ